MALVQLLKEGDWGSHEQHGHQEGCLEFIARIFLLRKCEAISPLMNQRGLHVFTSTGRVNHKKTDASLFVALLVSCVGVSVQQVHQVQQFSSFLQEGRDEQVGFQRSAAQ